MTTVTWDDLKISLSYLKFDYLIDDWGWLIGKEVTPILVTTLGDVFYQSSSGEILWLDTGCAEVKLAAPSLQEFETKLGDSNNVDEWFLPNIIGLLKSNGMLLEDGQVYSYDRPPTLGGKYTVDNFRPADVNVHITIHGQINAQINDLPEGTTISSINVKE